MSTRHPLLTYLAYVDAIANLPLNWFDLSQPTVKTLARGKILTVRQLLTCSIDDLRDIRWMGVGRRTEVVEMLARYGITLPEHPRDEEPAPHDPAPTGREIADTTLSAVTMARETEREQRRAARRDREWDEDEVRSAAVQARRTPRRSPSYTRPRDVPIPPELSDVGWLRYWFIDQQRSVFDMSTALNVSDSRVTKAIRKAGLARPRIAPGRVKRGPVLRLSEMPPSTCRTCGPLLPREDRSALTIS